MNRTILTLNGGSSTIRFAIYDARTLKLQLAGKVDHVGTPNMALTTSPSSAGEPGLSLKQTKGDVDSVQFLLDWLEAQSSFSTIVAVGHRVVHGMARSEPEMVTAALLDDLRAITPYDPDHLPLEIKLIERVCERLPSVHQVACFDTAFHRTMPRVAMQLPIPRELDQKGVQRYGFHGLSYSFLLEELANLGDPAAKTGAVILAHLGSGASMAAVLDGKSIDTSMSFTPTAGLVMGTRTGDLDPGLGYFLSRTEGMTPAKFNRMVNHESGLLGVSEISSDVRELLALESKDKRAAEALALFCYQAKKWIGSYAAALGGLDTLVFAGGIGENAPAIRRRICDGLGFLGVELNAIRNDANSGVISSDSSKVRVRVVQTNEELMIARSVSRLLNLSSA